MSEVIENITLPEEDSGFEDMSVISDAYEKRNDISRYKMREQAVLVIFESLFSDSDIDEIADNIIDSRDLYLSDYALNVAKAISQKLSELDEVISLHLSKGWKISRISRVALSVLRVALYEMKYEDSVPTSVAINEAVELTKKYSPEDASFVHGVLGAIASEAE
ncbi:MAG: transcription antitermination factor NusB [Ruminococcus sp.]